MPSTYNEKRTASSINSVKETEQPQAKEWNWSTISHHTQKLIQNEIKILNIRPETITFLEENIGDNLLDTGLGPDFFN